MFAACGVFTSAGVEMVRGMEYSDYMSLADVNNENTPDNGSRQRYKL